MTRSELINSIIKKNNYKTYLEIGVNNPSQPGWNFDSVGIETKHGVDPADGVNATYKMESDEFFAKQIKMKYDIVFIDGLHIFEQAYRDIVNSLKWLNENGTIVVHDCNPKHEITQRRVKVVSAWHGDVWKAILKLRMEDPNISIFTVNTDEGCAVIKKGSQKPFETKEDKDSIYNFPFFKRNRKEILNLISVRKFRKIMGLDSWFKSTMNKLLRK